MTTSTKSCWFGVKDGPTHSPRDPIGGYKVKEITFSEISKYIVNEWHQKDLEGHVLKFAAYVEREGSKPYDNKHFVKANIPLNVLATCLAKSTTVHIANQHNIHLKARKLVIKDIKQAFAAHTCETCPEFYTVFSAVCTAVLPSREAIREKMHSHVPVSKVKPDSHMLEPKIGLSDTDTPHTFPPDPPNPDFARDIIRQCSDRFHPENVEEAGCAVCGQLVKKKTLVWLKSMKNHFGVLTVPDITRVEWKSDGEKICGYHGPVLDHTAEGVCQECRAALYHNKIPDNALAKGTWLGSVPPVLQNLSFMEKMLIARVRHTCAFVRISTGMKKMKANVIAFENLTPKIYDILPPPIEDIQEVMAILFTGSSKTHIRRFQTNTCSSTVE